MAHQASHNSNVQKYKYTEIKCTVFARQINFCLNLQLNVSARRLAAPNPGSRRDRK